MNEVKITRYEKFRNKWIVISKESETVTAEYYNNIKNDKNVFGGGTRTTNNYSQFGKMDSKTFYSPSKKQKTVYKF